MKNVFLLMLFSFFSFISFSQCYPIYVSTTGTALGDGTEANPMDLQTALTQSCVQARYDIRVLAGTYNLTNKMVVGCDNIIIDGDWEIVAGVGRKNSSLTTTINIDSPLQTASYNGAAGTTVGFYIGIEAIGRLNTRIEDITFNVKNGGTSGTATGTTGNRGNSVYGFYFRNSTGYILERVNMNVGSGSSGSTGTNGAVSANGVNGANGVGGDCNDDCITNNGGAGGTGASGGGAGGPTVVDPSCGSTSGLGNPGNIGANTANPIAGGGGGSGAGGGSENNSGGRGGNGGSNVAGGGLGGNANGAGGAGYGSTGCTTANADGRAGTPGSNGVAGAAGALANTSAFNIYWLPSGQSTNGANGTGGGGGQGGGGGGGQGCFFCIDGTGGAGGGGGGGGQGGAGGTGGWGGGGTFALFSFNSTGVRNNCTITAGPAATGGTGGTGATGGTGGIGGQGADGNNTSTTGGGVLTGTRLCGACIETGAGGRGGNGGNGGIGGNGGAGAPGLSSIVEIQSGGTSTANTVAAITQIITNQPLAGCTNSEIVLTKNGGTWGITGSGAYINDLNSASSSYNNTSATAVVSYTTTGAQSVSINGVPYDGFIIVNTTRALPTFDASMSATVCEGNTFSMNTSATGAQYEWVIFPASGSAAVPTAVFTTSLASWTTPVTGITTNYRVRLRVRQTCCGWSTPVYFNFSVVGSSAGPVASGVTICENGTAALTATGSGAGNITWYADPLGQNSLQTSAGVVSNYTTNVLSNNTVYYVGEGIGSCISTLTAVPVTVTSAPADPTPAATAVCSGQNTILTASGATGSFSWYNVPTGGGPIATGATYNVGALANGTYTFYLSESNGTCASNRVPVSVTVYSNPAAPTVSAVTICTNTSTSLSATGTGTVRWYSDAGLTNLLGTGSTYTTPVLSANTTYYVTQQNTSGCNSSSASLPVTVTGSVIPTLAVSASSTSICSGTAVNFTATPTNGGATPNYDWFVNGVSQAVNVTSFSSSTLANNDVVTAQLTSNATCATPATANSNNVLITVTSSATPSIAITSSATSICQGTQVNFSSNTTYGGNTPSIQWQVNGSNVGSNNPNFSSNTLVTGDVVSAILTSSGTCVTTATANSNNIAITVTPNVTPILTIAASATTICAGTSVTFTATPTNGGVTPTYEWYINGIAQGTNSATFTTSTLNASDMVFARMVSSATCVSNDGIASSNNIVMTVNPVVTPTASIAASSTTICAGTAVTFNASTTNGGSAPTYQWMLNGAPVGGNSNVYSNNTLANTDAITLTLTSSAACATTATATSNSIAMVVNPNVSPSISIVASSNTICSGTSVTFTATPTNTGATPTYEWFVNGIAQGVNATTFTTTTLNQLDVVAAQLTSTANCAQPTVVGSNSVVMTVNPITTPSIAITASSNNVCSGTPVIFSAAVANGGNTPTIQWTINGFPVGSNSATFSITTLNTGDVVQATLTSSAACVTVASATSNAITMTVNANVVPTISIAASATTICDGTSVTFTASTTNTGATPLYDWKINGVSQGVNATTFTSATLNDNDVITAELASNAPCANPTLVTSNSVVVTVNSITTPIVSFSADQNPVCSGDLVTFTASSYDNGALSTFDWTVNGLSVSSNPVAFTTAGLANGDVVGLTLTSGAACPSVATVTATPITMTVATNLTPSVSIQASTTSECAGTSVSFLATPVNGGASPIYEWYINGVAQGVNSPNFSSSTLNQGDVVNVQLTSNASCASVSTVSSNSVFMTINPVLTPTIAISASATAICANEAVNFFATVADAGSSPTIQWYLNGNPVGSNNTVLTLSGLISSDVVTAMVTSTAVCTTTPTANSNAISLTVSNTVVPMAFITVPSTIFCPGSAVTFGSNITNGGATPTYDWYLNGTSTGITTPTYSTSTLSNGDVVMLVLTSSSTCASTPTVTSNSITMFSNTSATGSVNITSLTGSLCEGGTLTFIGIPQNVSGTINYQWTVNGVNAGTNNSVFTSTSLVANDAVELTISYQDACGNNLTATSNTITIQETPVVDAGTDVSIQTGTSVTLNGTTSVAGSILWSPAGSLSNASILTPTASPSLTTTYLLTVQTPNGCEASDVVTITIDQDVFEIFNSFSPNADGTNDTWNIPNASNYPEISVQIFNKWGNLLYEQNKVYVPWDGTNDGAKLPSDTYFYIVKLSPASDALKGSVTIVR